ncbi:MAG TPA: hypothetical protein VKZ63_18395 [Kofleriaceae bacterium]|nr:hypothetical protein [Kofleriaceae bacterium]
MHEVLTGVYRSRAGAARAAAQLMEAGFTREEVCLLAPEAPGAAHFAAVPRRAMLAGVGGGALAGLALGAAAGAVQAVAAVGLPALEPLAGPPLLSTLAGGGAGAALGAILGAVVGLFKVRHEAVVQSGDDDEGGYTLVGVAAPRTMARSAAELLEMAGASRVKRG